MAFEKSKVLKAAEKFLSMGNINAAIKEYRQLVEHDEDDFTALNMLGDLCVRAGIKEEAIKCFTRIAEHYREQEFTLKAVAMYKKIDRLNPRNPQIAEKLASLYAVQGLIVDARAQYMIVAESYSSAGDTKKALDVLHKIADLDVQNTDVRLKLAEAYLKEGLQSDAAQAFAEAGVRLAENRSYEKALQAFSRALEIKPQFQIALEGIVKAHSALGTAYEAAELLEKVLVDRPGDHGLITLLLTSYIEAHDAAGAERTTALLMSHDASNYTRFLDVARLHLSNGDIDAAAKVLSGVAERALAGREEGQLLELVHEVLARNPEQILALRLLVRVHWWQRDTEKLRAALDRLAEAAEAAGQADDERYALTQLTRLIPDEQRYADRLRDLGGAQEQEPIDDLLMRPDENVGDVPAFESFAIVTDEEYGTVVPAESEAQGAEFEFNSVATETISDPAASFADLNDEWESGNASPVSGSNEVDFSGAILDSSVAAEGSADGGADTERRVSILQQELESVDFYISQGYTDIALDTLEMLERQFTANPAIEERRAKLREMGINAPSPKPGESGAEFVGNQGAWDVPGVRGQEPAMMIMPESAAPSSNGNGSARPKIDSGLADIFEEFRVAAENEEDTSSEDFETHYNMGIAYKEMDLLDEAVREFQTAVGLTLPKDGTSRFLSCCNMLGHCFVEKNLPKAAVIWFKKGLEAPGHSEEEYQALRYELAAAFELMGDFGQAVDTFTELYSADVSYRDVADRLHELQAKKVAVP
jgi:tetratricopeptide (TPR) repeat protein